MRFPRILLVSASVALACAAYLVFAPSTGWSTDYEAARATAAKSGKKLMLDFTGSDWCIYCKKLDKEVFSTPEFKAFSKDYVLVCLDYPKEKELPEAEKKQNDALEAEFKIDSFPTVIIADPSGREIKRASGYEPDSGPAAYLAQFAQP
jgi:thioredoxin-related protein